jgi:hypothetical protein
MRGAFPAFALCSCDVLHSCAMRSIPAWLTLLGVAFAVGGCALIQPPDAGLGTGVATFATGQATMTVAGERIVLDQLGPGPHLLSGLGAAVDWFNDDGWGLRLTGGGDGTMIPPMLSIDRVQTTYWSAQDDGSSCRITLEQANADGVKGSGTCSGLRWTDMIRGGFDNGGYVEGEPAFDATMEFEALPAVPGA